ncbi:NAD-dependent epimerase/dehydratase [Spirulina sp. CS-785/01]|uniref:NAD-dependent epimerase/dehydratase family protein n=1 Tax=Spirulina sp. CS-785/01 TaxID=3021716 RepID=UPI00232BF3C4|nr:NAD-dependent epimerase/dehydratase [Spirulina sp. CS-785/01]MDB9315382.1 NAD-dependent epimerase/dehydratase [Spirulina sp. CS-785/01]
MNTTSVKTVLLTGGTGFLGSQLASELLHNNYQVIILKRSFSNTQRIQSILPQVSLYDIDKIQLEQPFQDFPKIDAVIHTATCHGLNQEHLSEVLSANTWFPLRLLEIAADYQTSYFINTDTFYNKANYSSQHRNGYTLSKKQFFSWGKLASQAEKIKFINLRIEHLFGAGDSEKKFVTFLFRSLIQNKPHLPLTQGEQKRDFIHVKDAISAYLTILQNSDKLDQWYHEYDVGRGEAVTLRSLIETIHQLSHSQTVLEFGAIPYRQGDIMYSQGDITALKQLGWQPQPDLATRIQETIIAEKQFLSVSKQ